jgi:hypothetical protein
MSWDGDSGGDHFYLTDSIHLAVTCNMSVHVTIQNVIGFNFASDSESKIDFLIQHDVYTHFSFPCMSGFILSSMQSA